MARRYLLDTDVLIWHLRGHRPTESVLRSISHEQPLACSSLSVFEVWCGARKREQADTRRFLDTLQQIPTDSAIARLGAEYWSAFRAQGVTLGRADAMIAATARALDLVLVTYNGGHYPMEDVLLYRPMPDVE